MVSVRVRQRLRSINRIRIAFGKKPLSTLAQFKKERIRMGKIIKRQDMRAAKSQRRELEKVFKDTRIKSVSRSRKSML